MQGPRRVLDPNIGYKGRELFLEIMRTYLYVSVIKRRFGVVMSVKEMELLLVCHNWENEVEAMRVERVDKINYECWESE